MKENGYDVTLSIDAMGGANAPTAVLEAIDHFCACNDSVSFIIYGTDEKVYPLLERYNVPSDRCIFVPTESVISDDEKPIDAFRNGKNSSMRKAIEAVRDKCADACVSSGNTGALMVIAKAVLGGLSSIKRPAIVTSIPTLKGKSVMLDMGANTECNELILFQFALMGTCFARQVLRINDPKIGLLNIGTERGKGRELEQKSYDLLHKSGLNFHGYIEGNDITTGAVDVIVTDGFTGNVAIKVLEGAFYTGVNMVKKAWSDFSFFAKLGALLVRPSLKRLMSSVVPEVSNGAMFVGINGIVVKSHGSSKTQGIVNAFNVAATLAHNKINDLISNELKMFEEKGIGLDIMSKIKQTSAKFFGLHKK